MSSIIAPFGANMAPQFYDTHLRSVVRRRRYRLMASIFASKATVGALRYTELISVGLASACLVLAALTFLTVTVHVVWAGSRVEDYEVTLRQDGSIRLRDIRLQAEAFTASRPRRAQIWPFSLFTGLSYYHDGGPDRRLFIPIDVLGRLQRIESAVQVAVVHRRYAVAYTGTSERGCVVAAWDISGRYAVAP